MSESEVVDGYNLQKMIHAWRRVTNGIQGTKARDQSDIET
jgi:hypothetical protein